MQTHRELYPAQYTHPLCGKRVTVRCTVGPAPTGTVTRVVPSRFGELAIIDDNARVAYNLSSLIVHKTK